MITKLSFALTELHPNKEANSTPEALVNFLVGKSGNSNWTLSGIIVIGKTGFNMKNILVLFSNIGTVSLGIKSLYDEARVIGIDNDFKLAPYRLNSLETIDGSVYDIPLEQVKFNGDLDLLWINLPVKDFVKINTNSRNPLIPITVLFRWIRHFAPKHLVIYSTKNIVSKGENNRYVMNFLKRNFREMGYNFQFEVTNFKYYGLPESRPRGIIRASLGRDKMDNLPNMTSPLVGWGDVISDELISQMEPIKLTKYQTNRIKCELVPNSIIKRFSIDTRYVFYTKDLPCPAIFYDKWHSHPLAIIDENGNSKLPSPNDLLLIKKMGDVSLPFNHKPALKIIDQIVPVDFVTTVLKSLAVSNARII